MDGNVSVKSINFSCRCHDASARLGADLVFGGKIDYPFLITTVAELSKCPSH